MAFLVGGIYAAYTLLTVSYRIPYPWKRCPKTRTNPVTVTLKGKIHLLVSVGCSMSTFGNLSWLARISFLL